MGIGNVRLVALSIIAGAALAACASGSKNHNSTPSPAAPSATLTPGALSPTPDGPILHLGVGEMTEGTFRGVMTTVLGSPYEFGNCAMFWSLSDIDAERALEAGTVKVNPKGTLHLTPVPDDQARAGQIIKEVCDKFATATATAPRTPTPR